MTYSKQTIIKICSFLIIPLLVSSCLLDDNLKLGGLADDDCIIAHYPLDGNAKDASGNGHHGELTGTLTPSEDRLGNSDKALYFDGSSEITIPNENGMNISDTDFTISLWFYNETTTSTRNFFAARDSDGSPSLSLNLSASSSGLNVTIGANSYSVSNSLFTLNNQWFHIVFIFNNEDLTMTVYINSEYIDSVNVASFSCDGNQNFYIGASISPATYFIGKIDNLTVFKRTLSAKEVKILYTNSL